MVELFSDFRDVFRAGRYGFSGKKITIHLLGLIFGYLIYQILVYLSLLIVGGTAARDFWDKYALLPVHPFVDYNFASITRGAMWVGLVILFAVFFLTSTMVSKITIQQLRGDNFFSMRESGLFLKKNWRAVLGVFVTLIVIFLLLALVPTIVGLLGMIPKVGGVIVAIALIFAPFAFFIGLLMTYIVVVFSVSLFFAPAVVASADSDTFETIYQHFSMIWNQPGRILVYEALLFGLKLICVPIWAIFCLFGFSVAMLPIRYLVPMQMKMFMGYADVWLGGGLAKLTALPYLELFVVFDTIAPANLPADGFSGFELYVIKVTSIFMTLSLLFIAGLVIAYLLSIASVGNTLIYVVLRKRVDSTNLLELEEEEILPPDTSDSSTLQGEETNEAAPENEPSSSENNAH